MKKRAVLETGFECPMCGCSLKSRSELELEQALSSGFDGVTATLRINALTLEATSGRRLVRRWCQLMKHYTMFLWQLAKVR